MVKVRLRIMGRGSWLAGRGPRPPSLARRRVSEMPPPKVETREMEGGSVEVRVSGLPQSKEEDEIRSAVESHVGPVTLDLQRAEVAHMQTVQFLVGLADHLATQQRLLRIVYRSLPTEPDRTERILDDSGVLAHPNIVAVP